MMEDRRWQKDLDLIRDAARQAGEVALGFFGQSPEVWWKNEGQSPVSAADFAANDRLLSVLRAARPDYGWLSEENDDDHARLSADTVFVVDPIDGTRGFIQGATNWCVSVAVVHKGAPVAGVLFAPALGEEFYAAIDGPALKNGKTISVAEHRPDDVLNIAASAEMVNKFEPEYRKLLSRVKHVPSLAYRLAMVADGRIDGTLVARNSHDWDLAAADLILFRAGGSLVETDGSRLVYNRETVKHATLFAGGESVIKSLLRQAHSG
ncbi:myo-inositol-1(or 4)-monophosphatase [Neorhizobium huautlense]|uniref:Myo-inositol-1(Or 4)-monophosphatase n=2 Tax=Neorhizobium huautlense TaxID=67774 RepID=A0ABT9PN72_9HYPH|nr:3'(2'),5'-bisphosphate nucleotidase CysQ [Neorhizobium huautlense]MDP9835339.1 myo-inositol-1(or 4)-monophosphatase [Neorhizobium huautlense]